MKKITFYIAISCFLFVTNTTFTYAQTCCASNTDCVRDGYVGSCTGYHDACVTTGNRACVFRPGTGEISSFFNEWNQTLSLKNSITSPEAIINALIPLLIVIAGVILLLMLILGGFQMLTSAANPDQAEAGKKRITTALAGFLIIFVSYWLIQILEILLGINILGTTP